MIHPDRLAVAFAVALAVLLLCSYLEGHKLTIRTEHDALNWIVNPADTTGKLAC